MDWRTPVRNAYVSPATRRVGHVRSAARAKYFCGEDLTRHGVSTERDMFPSRAILRLCIQVFSYQSIEGM